MARRASLACAALLAVVLLASQQGFQAAAQDNSTAGNSTSGDINGTADSSPSIQALRGALMDAKLWYFVQAMTDAQLWGELDELQGVVLAPDNGAFADYGGGSIDFTVPENTYLLRYHFVPNATYDQLVAPGQQNVFTTSSDGRNVTIVPDVGEGPFAFGVQPGAQLYNMSSVLKGIGKAGGLDVVPVAAFVEAPQLPQATLYNALTTRASNDSAAGALVQLIDADPELQALTQDVDTTAVVFLPSAANLTALMEDKGTTLAAVAGTPFASMLVKAHLITGGRLPVFPAPTPEVYISAAGAPLLINGTSINEGQANAGYEAKMNVLLNLNVDPLGTGLMKTIVYDVDGVLGGWASVDAEAPAPDSNSTSPTSPGAPSTGNDSALAPVPPGSSLLPPQFAASTTLGANAAVLLAAVVGAAMVMIMTAMA